MQRLCTELYSWVHTVAKRLSWLNHKFCHRSGTRADVRAASQLRLLSLSPERTLPLIYPRLFALGSLLAELPKDTVLSELRLPESVPRLSAAKLSEDGVFLLENGYEAYVQFGARVSSELMMALLGAYPATTCEKVT